MPGSNLMNVEVVFVGTILHIRMCKHPNNKRLEHFTC